MSNFAKDTNTMDAAWQLYDAERMANEALLEQLSVAASEILALRKANNECVEYFAESQKDLAEKDAEIERLKLEHETAYKLVDYWQKKCAASQAAEARYEELHVAARRCLRYDGVDPAKFNESMRNMDALIQRHIGEINEMEDLKNG